MLLAAGLFTGLSPAMQDGLHPRKGLDRYEWLVYTGVLDAFPSHEADVKRIDKETVNVLRIQDVGCSTLRGLRSQPSCGESIGQLPEGVVAGGISLECPPDKRCLLGFDL